MVQTGTNKIFQEVHGMNPSNQVTYEEYNVTVKVERIFTGEKTVDEMVLELLRKQRENRGFLPLRKIDSLKRK